MYIHPGKRPRFLSLLAFKFPLNAKLSILHRITGVFLLISLIGYIALLHLILLHPSVTLASVSEHCIIACMSTVFWSTLIFHWLTGVRHLIAEHFTQIRFYQIINSDWISYLIILLWLSASYFVYQYFWIGA